MIVTDGPWYLTWGDSHHILPAKREELSFDDYDDLIENKLRSDRRFLPVVNKYGIYRVVRRTSEGFVLLEPVSSL